MKKLTSLAGKLLLLGSVLALGANSVQAATTNIYWKGGASGSLVTNTNWNLNSAGTGGTATAAQMPSTTNPTPFNIQPSASIVMNLSAANNTGGAAQTLNLTLPASNYTTWFTGNPTSGDSEWAGLVVAGTSTGAGTAAQTGAVNITSTSGPADLALGVASVTGTSNMITVGAGSGAVTIGSATQANAVYIDSASQLTNTVTDYEITNNSSSTLSIQNTLTVRAGGGAFTTTLLVDGTGVGQVVFNGTTGNVNNNGGGISDGSVTGHLTALQVGTGSGSVTTVKLNSASTYSGGTTVNGGTLIANATGALNSASGTTSVLIENGGTLKVTANGAITGSTATNITVQSGGSLAFGSSAITNGVDTGTNLTLSGGSLVMNGATQTIGTLTLVAGTTSTIDMTGGGTLTLNNITWGLGAQLDIVGWSGTNTGSSTTAIFLSKVGGNAEANWLTNEADVSWLNVTFNGVTGNIYNQANIYHVTGNTYQGIPAGIPVPEPSTVFFGLGLLALLAWGGRQQLLEAGRNLVPVRV